jgi:hypothetical protein
LMRSDFSVNLTLPESEIMTARVKEFAQLITRYQTSTNVQMSSLRLLRPENSISVAPPRPSRLPKPT